MLVILNQLLNISIQINYMKIPDNIKTIFLKKIDILRNMHNDATLLIKMIDESDRRDKNKLKISKSIREYYDKYQIMNYHQTYNLTKKYQRRIVYIPLKCNYKCFSDCFYNYKNKLNENI